MSDRDEYMKEYQKVYQRLVRPVFPQLERMGPNHWGGGHRGRRRPRTDDAMPVDHFIEEQDQ